MAYAVEVVLRACLPTSPRSAHRFDARTKPGNLSRRSVAVKNALSDAAMQLGLRRLERRLRRGLVAGGDGRLDLLDEGSNAAHARVVRGRTARVMSDPFLGGLVMRHFHSPAMNPRKRRAYSGGPDRRQGESLHSIEVGRQWHSGQHGKTPDGTIVDG